MAKSSRGGKIGASGSENTVKEQKATNAKLIENMNEAQIDEEIAKAKRIIERDTKTISDNSITNTAEANAMREAFPLGFGAATPQQIKRQAQINERDARKAATAVKAYDDRKATESRLEKLEKAKKQVGGTGKTQRQISEEKVKTAVSSAPKNLTWKQTQKQSYVNGVYRPKIIKSGDFEIHGSDGFFTVYREGKKVGSVNKLATAKALAEKLNK